MGAARRIDSDTAAAAYAAFVGTDDVEEAEPEIALGRLLVLFDEHGFLEGR